MRKKILISDPIHQVLSFGSDPKKRKLLKAVIDTQTFQRLRKISQLGLASMVFPGATHTRFSHSLGAAFLAYRILSHLEEQEEGNNNVREEIQKHRFNVVVSALLHDLGHGPFSHSFERVLNNFKSSRKGSKKGKDWKEKLKAFAPMHEDWTAELITNSKSDIKKALKDNSIDCDLIASPFSDNDEKSYPTYLKQIISSQLDADRMDYLNRDSHFCGVSLGTIDTAYLVDCMTVLNHGEIKSRTLGLTKKGIKPYEGFVIARHFMNLSVYNHHRIKVFELMMESFIQEIVDNIDLFKKRDALRNLIPPYLISLGNLVKTLQSGRNPVSKADFMKSNFEAYISLTEDKIWTLLEAVSTLRPSIKTERTIEIARMLLKREKLSHFFLSAGKDSVLKKALKLKEGRDYVIVPLESTLYKQKTSKDDSVFVTDSSNRHIEITKYSELISSYRDKPEGKKILIVMDEKHTSKIEEVGRTLSCFD